MIEAAVVIDQHGRPLYWHSPPDRSVGYIPDSDKLWNAIWDNRAQIGGVAHTHPGSGLPGPSHEDLTTFMAVEKGLGRPLTWWILSKDRTAILQRSLIGFNQDHMGVYGLVEIPDPPWAAELRANSEYDR